MSIFFVENYIVKVEKQGEFVPRLQEFLKY